MKSVEQNNHSDQRTHINANITSEDIAKSAQTININPKNSVYQFVYRLGKNISEILFMA